MNDPRLTANGNLLLAAIMSIPAVVLTWLYRAQAPTTAAGVVLGILAGVLQTRAFRAAPDRFAEAKNASEFRAALRATTDGKRSLILQWCCAVVTLIVAWILDRQSFGMGLLASFSAFIAAREVTAYPALKRLWP